MAEDSELNPYSLAVAIAVQHKRPTIPVRHYSTKEEGYLDLMQQCWSQDPTQRPSFYVIQEQLLDIMNK